jgi:hypothetical protein
VPTMAAPPNPVVLRLLRLLRLLLLLLLLVSP